MADDPQEELDGEHRIFRDRLLDNLIGEWDVRGTILGQAFRHRCEAGWVLNHQFMRIHFQDVTPRPLKGAPGSENPRYEAFVFIGRDNMSERYVVHWLDTFGGRSSETLGYASRVHVGRANPLSITFVFEGATGPLHNTLSWSPRGRRWTMAIRQKDGRGAWRTFATETFVKTSPPRSGRGPRRGSRRRP